MSRGRIAVTPLWLTTFVGLALYLGCTSSPKPQISPTSPPAPAPYTPTGKEPVVAVFDFENVSLYGDSMLGKAAAQAFQTELWRSKRCRVVDRENLPRINEEHIMALSGITGESNLQIGNQLGVQYIITGKVTECGIRRTGRSVSLGVVEATTFSGAGGAVGSQKGTARLVVDVKITDVETGLIVYMTSAVGEAYSESVKTIAGLMQSGVIFGVSGSGGVQGFDETIEGMAARAAAMKAVNEMIREWAFGQ